MTNPSSIVRFHSRTGGRGSVAEANMAYQLYGQGLFNGTGVVESGNADMNVIVGGSNSAPDIVLAESPAGYKVALDIVGTAQLTITAPASNSRISAVVAYTDDLSIASTEDTVTGNPATCGLIVVDGTTAANPNVPTEAQIRTAITADGATGSQAAYAVVAYITVSSATTVVTSSLIKNTDAKGAIALLAHPVGSYYETSDTSFDPNVEWGGTWVEDTAGRMLVAQDSGTFTTVGATGGAEKHQHDIGLDLAGNFGEAGIEDPTTGLHDYAADGTHTKGSMTISSTGSRQFNSSTLDASTTKNAGTITFAGSTTYESGLPPYTVVKRWHRTA